MRSPADTTIDRLLLLYLLKMAMSFGIDGDVKFQQLVFLSELQLFGKQATGFHYRFFRYAYGGYSKELADDFIGLCAKQFAQKPTFVLTPAGETVLKIIPGIAKERTENETVLSIIQDIVKAYGKYDSSSIVPEVEKITRMSRESRGRSHCHSGMSPSMPPSWCPSVSRRPYTSS